MRILFFLAIGILVAATVLVMDDQRRVHGGTANPWFTASRTRARLYSLIGLSIVHISPWEIFNMTMLGISFVGERVTIGLFGNRPDMVKRLGRSSIIEFTKASSKRLMAWLEMADVGNRYFGTLTIPHVETDGEEFKARLDRFLKSALAQGKRVVDRPSITWFLEFQERGSPHVHLVYNWFMPFDWASRRWVDCWKDRIPDQRESAVLEFRSACSKFETIRGSVTWYASKYASKAEQKTVPDNYRSVGRFWGIRGCRDRVPRVSYVWKGDSGRKNGNLTVLNTIWHWFFVELARNFPRMRMFKWREGVGFTVYLGSGAEGAEDFRRSLSRAWGDFGEVRIKGGRKEHADRLYQSA